jgi:heme/copper-type cytochrome/quinol oxidase subunit 2
MTRVAAFCVAYFQAPSPVGILNPAAPQALRIQSVFWFIFWICLFVFVVVNLFLWFGAKKRVVTEP